MSRFWTLAELNAGTMEDFLRACGGVFEHSPWIAERAWAQRGEAGFASREALHGAMVRVLMEATEAEQLGLIRAHPDLVGRLAREGRLTRESTREQTAAGLSDLTADEVERFEAYNAAYRERFGFPFVICARENRKDSILRAFPVRLKNERSEEIQTALGEIAKIAKLRLMDVVSEN